MEAINKNNVKTLKSILKLLENEHNKWPLPIEQHKIACINAIKNTIHTSEIVLTNGGIKTMVDNIQAYKKVDLFSELEQSKIVPNLQTVTT